MKWIFGFLSVNILGTLILGKKRDGGKIATAKWRVK